MVLKPKIIIVDIDGTIADKGTRDPYDWSRVGEDQPINLVISNIRALRNNVDGIIFLSGRSDECRWQTEMWLEHHALPRPWDLFMRKAGDYRADVIVKEEIYQENVEPFYEVVLVLDDRNSVVDMWRRKGLLTYQVAFGDF